MKKIIFLDHDGVLVTSKQYGSRFKKMKKWERYHPKEPMPIHIQYDSPDSQCIEVLNEILEETGADIVVSSDWRNYLDLEQLGELYNSWGIDSVPLDVTPNAHNRSAEIMQFVKECNVEKFVAIDDMYLVCPFFLKTKENQGLKEKGFKDKVINILNR